MIVKFQMSLCCSRSSLIIVRVNRLCSVHRVFLPLLILIFGCTLDEPKIDNPFDPENPDYEPPSVTIISAPESIHTSPKADFEWQGNELVDSFRSRFDSQAWSNWTSITDTTIDFLDEGIHTFAVQSRYQTGDTSSTVDTTFTVDAVTGPAIMFYPRRHFAGVGETVTFQILAEEVEGLVGVEFTIQHNTSELEIDTASIRHGSFVAPPDYTNPFFLKKQIPNGDYTNTTITAFRLGSTNGYGYLGES